MSMMKPSNEKLRIGLYGIYTAAHNSMFINCFSFVAIKELPLVGFEAVSTQDLELRL